MASRQFTVDSAKKREFINIFLLMPKSSVLNAMRQATFTKDDIADLPLWRFLQRALPGKSIKGLKAYIACQRIKLPPHLPFDPAAAHPRLPMTQQYLAASTNAATDAAATAPPEEVAINAGTTTVLSSLLPGTATKRKKDCKRWNRTVYQNKKNKLIGLFSLPAVMMTTTMQTTTTQMMTKTTTTTKMTTRATTTTALC